MSELVLEISGVGRTRSFAQTQMPVSIGGRVDSDVVLVGADGELQIGNLDGAWFAQVPRNVESVQLNGVSLRGSARIDDGDIVTLDAVRLHVTRDGTALRLRVALPAEAATKASAGSTNDDAAAGGDAGVSIRPIQFRSQAADSDAARSRRIRPSQIAIAAAFGVLAILGWFAFTAKSVQFVFEGQPQQVELPATMFKLRLGDRVLLRSGEHRVAAQYEGYYPLDTELEVSSNASQRIELPFEKLPGLVSISSTPSDDVRVYLGNRLLGSPPLDDVEIPEGQYTLRFELDRFFPEEFELDVRGAHARQRVSVELAQDWAPVNIASNPPGAQISIDGEILGTTPAQLELVQGQHALELRLPGYNAFNEDLEVTAGEPYVLGAIELVQADGRVQFVSSLGDVAVSLNGDYAGTTPLNLRLRPGRTHTVVASKPGHEALTLELSVAADSGRTVPLELVALFGEVTVVSEPPGAQVSVDGSAVAVTPATFELSALPHEIEVTLDGHAPRRQSLTPRAGLTHQLEFSLDPLDDATGDGYPRRIRTSHGHELVVVPAGEFTMGSSRREEGRRSNEVLHQVRLTRAFYLGTTEVTNAQFRRFRPEHDSGSAFEQTLDDDDQPVVNISWDDAVEYLNWLSIEEGLQPVYESGPDGWTAQFERSGYRLPTEAEWEWAARYSHEAMPLVFPWSGALEDVTPPDRHGNYADVSAAAVLPTTLITYNDDFVTSAPVASFAASTAGIYDIGGNVAEWMHDFYALDAGSNQAVPEDPTGPESGAYRVVRGSSWRNATLTQLRLSARDYEDGSRDDLGFRPARGVTGVENDR